MPENESRTLTEHESRETVTSKDGAELSQTSEELKAVKKVEKIFARAKKYREKYDKNWLKYYKFFRGKQWDTERPSYRHSPVINFVFRAIQSVIPILTDSRPKFSFIPNEPSDLQLSEIINAISDDDWSRNNWLYQLTEMLYDTSFYGASFGEMSYDPKANLGLGNVSFESRDTFYVYPDPTSVDVNKKSRNFTYAEPIDIDIVKQRYPEKGKFVKADINPEEIPDKTSLGKLKYESPTSNLLGYEADKSFSDDFENKTLLITCYVLDDESFDEEKEEVSNTETGKKTKVFKQKKKYPNGRKIVTASGILLHDGPIPFDDGKIPFARLVNYILPREFWGISDVENQVDPQQIFNKVVAFILDTLVLMGNPIWVVDNTSGIDTDNLFNRPGMVLEKNPGSEARRESGTQLQPYVFQLLDRTKEWFDEIMGDLDISRGIRPEGVSAGVAIERLQEASKTRIRQKSRNLDATLQDLGQMYLSRIQQFYTAPRVIRITNNDESSKYFKVHFDRDDNGKQVIRVRESVQGEDKIVRFGEEKVLSITDFGFDVKVTTGSSLPFSRVENENKLIQYYDRGIIDKEEILKGTDFPNWEAVLERIRQREAAAVAASAPPQA